MKNFQSLCQRHRRFVIARACSGETCLLGEFAVKFVRYSGFELPVTCLDCFAELTSLLKLICYDMGLGGLVEFLRLLASRSSW